MKTTSRDFLWPRLLATTCVAIFCNPVHAADLQVRMDADQSKITIGRVGSKTPILEQHAGPDFRPYLHPLVSPDGQGVLTDFSPDHHLQQHGIYFGFTRLNGRNYFHNPGAGYWRRVSSRVIKERGALVQWETAYQLLDDQGVPQLLETQVWSMREENGRYLMDLDWSGKALRSVKIDTFDYGGLFIRMPWREGIDASVVNSEGQRDQAAEGQRAKWVDIGMPIEGRADPGHIAILDHPDNEGHPLPWRVDGQFGVGPTRARLSAWDIPAGQTAKYRHRLIVYTGARDEAKLKQDWKAFSHEPAGMIH